MPEYVYKECKSCGIRFPATQEVVCPICNGDLYKSETYASKKEQGHQFIHKFMCRNTQHPKFICLNMHCTTRHIHRCIPEILCHEERPFCEQLCTYCSQPLHRALEQHNYDPPPEGPINPLKEINKTLKGISETLKDISKTLIKGVNKGH